MANNVEERLNTQNSSTPPTEIGQRFIWFLRKAVACLALDEGVDEDSIDMPCIEELSERAKTLLNEIAQEVEAICYENASTACKVQELRSIGIQVTSNGAEAWAVGKKVKQCFEEVAGNLGEVGEKKLSSLQEKVIEFVDEAIRPARQKISQKLLEQGKLQNRLRIKQVGYENTHVPEGSGNIFLSIGSAVANPFLKMFVYIKSEKINQALQLSREQEETYKAGLKRIENMERKANEAQTALGDCCLEWRLTQREMWHPVAEGIRLATEQQPFAKNIVDVELDAALSFQLSFEIQMKEFLNEMSPIESDMTLKVEEFYNHNKNISRILTQLLSTKHIIRDHHEKTFIAKVCELCQVLSDHLNKIREVFVPWTMYVTRGHTGPIPLIAEVTALTREMVPFDRNARTLTGEIRTILTAETSKSKSKRAQEKQKEGDKLHGSHDWVGRPLATATEALDTLQKVDNVVNVMWKLSNELGVGLMHHDNRAGQDSNSGSVGGTEPQDPPADPFNVSERTVAMVSTKLSSEIIRLNALAGSNSN